MKIFLVDKNKLNIYSLPNKIEDPYTINYISPTGVEETLTLLVEKGKWIISSAIDIKIAKNSVEISKEELDYKAIYQLKFNDLTDSIMMYCIETPLKYFNYEVGNKNEILVGKDDTNDIIFNSSYMANNQYKIYRQDNYWILEDNGLPDTLVFVNQCRVRKTVLKMGDVVFSNGLKLIWMNSFFKINNPNNIIKSRLQNYKEFDQFGSENVYTPISEAEKSISLYDDSQAFFHTPRLKSNITEKEISIANPPNPFKDDGPPAILTMGATIMMGISSSITSVISIFNVMSGKSSLINAISELFICASMILGTVMLPIFLQKFQTSRIKKKEKKRQERYGEYLNNKKKEIKEELEKETKILFENNLSVIECQNNIKEHNNKIWCREITDDDFLNLRIGIGNQRAKINIRATVEEFSLEDDNLKSEVEKIANDELILNNVPITVSLTKNKVLPLIINYDYPYRQHYINNLLLQIISLYSGMDLKIAIFTTEENEKKWEDFKFLPHCSSKDKSVLFFATNDDEMKQVSSYLEKEYQIRSESRNTFVDQKNQEENNNNNNNSYVNFDEYYLIITDNYISAKRYGIFQKIIGDQKNIGFSMFVIEPTMQNIPSKAIQFNKINKDNKGLLLNKEIGDNSQIDFAPEFMSDNIYNYIKIISNIPVSTVEMSNTLPPSLSFLEMYKAGKIEQLGILNKWEKNDPTSSLNTPIGVHENGKLFEIDLHEKYHGPHGLIAGSTGSGKSEFIITFVLSMAVNYHPYEVQFVLIDYKGGGLAGAFENRETGVKIPHLVGTITNLDTAEMNRTLVSIKSELQRRQRVFNEARDALNESTVDIYKYQKFYREGKVKDPISHLFIISDEFAELKQQQPDFMDELVSTARIGRSLGVHLILATQKPAGVVNDQIWSNSRFKVCLKVQSTEDSNELLKRPDAAYIKETGRFYFQVGYDELFEIGQSAWSGARYIPTDKIIKTVDDYINIIDNNGNIIRKIKDEVKADKVENYGDQLTNIVKNLYDIAKRENIEFKQLWLPSIPEDIFLANIIKKYNYKSSAYKIETVVGEYDNPTDQFQGLLSIDLTNNGNVLIFGNPGSGKENLISTMIYSLCISHTSDEVNFYIIDCGAETLKQFNKMPHIGDVCLLDDNSKINNLFNMLDREINKRRELFSEYGGSYVSYISNSDKKLPLIVVVLNSYESFAENFGNTVEQFIRILRDSSKYGVVFIMSAISANSLGSRVSQLFNNKLATQLTDTYDYQYYLNAPNGLIPAKYFGRGISTFEDTAYEFQTAYIYEKSKINDVIRATADKLCQNYKKVKSIPIIPDIINQDNMSQYIDNINNVPIGIDIDDASIIKYDFLKNKITQIIGNNALIDSSFTMDLIGLLSNVANIKFKIIDFADCLNDPGNLDYANDQFTENINKILESEQTVKGPIIYMILGIGYIYDRVLDEGIEALFKVFSNISNINNSYFVFVDNYSSYKKVMQEKWFSSAVNTNDGIWIGTGVDTQDAIKFNNMTKTDINENMNGICYVANNSTYKVIKGIGSAKKEEGGFY